MSLLKLIQSRDWAMLPESLHALQEAASVKVDLSASDMEPIKLAAKPIRKVKGAVGVISIRGVIMNNPSFIMQLFGAVDVQMIRSTFDEMMSNDSIGAIVLHIDSPGGEVFGVMELADHIFQNRDQGKRIISYTDGFMCSAAYFIGSAAENVIASPTALIGSIGVYTTHIDISKFNENEGVSVTYVYAGKYKVEENPNEPLASEAQAAMQKRIDQYYDQFVSAVAKYRGDTKKNVINGYGEGRCLHATHALEANLIDKIDTIENVLATLTGAKKSTSGGKQKRLRQLQSF